MLHCITLHHYVSGCELEVGHGDAGAVNVTLAAAARHAVQPAHVDAAAAPERGREHHVRVGGSASKSCIRIASEGA